MKPPPFKKARNCRGSNDVSIEQIVEQALLSDDVACESLLRRLIGFEKEVVDTVVVISKGVNASKIYLRGPFSKVIREHFTLIGVATAIDRLKEFHGFIVDSVDSKCVRFNYPSLRMTSTNENCDEVAEARTMGRHPYMATLSMLLDFSDSDISDRIIELIALQELPAHERKEAADLIVSFLPSYCSRCSNKQLQIFLEFVISEHSEEKTVCFERYSEVFSESVRKYFEHGIETKWKIDEVLSSSEESLLNAFLSIPVQSLSPFAAEQYVVVAAMLASRTQFTHEKLFSSSIHVLGLLIRFSALLVTTKWEALSKSPEEVQTEILGKIRNKYLCEILHSIDWKNADRVQPSAERWLTSSIIAGEFNFEKIVVDRALTFQLKYLPFVYEGARNLENIIDWKVLLYLQRVGISLDVPISILSTERVLELLATCSSELEITNETLSIVAKLISPRLKSVATTCLVLLASIFERAENCIELLSCAASALESFGHTDVERDIVVLCLSIASSQPLNDAVYNHIRGVQKVIQNAMLYAHHAVNNDQCALFAQLFVKVTKAVQRFIINKLGTAEQVDELIHALNSLAHNIIQHKVYYSRVSMNECFKILAEEKLLHV
ncbi:unnamed protein product [Angiostrongylus costaricensis]|uniref:NopRA1 domain-containing protein n=1 Tax=Angiostrongylus costaricensis TaxID=334426 RepID=A0A158PJW9_ANGCS|nr:unnamed protein product [Angiostrongylus costaricensis]